MNFGTTTSRPGMFTSFTRSQISSIVATIVDFGTLVFLVEVVKLWYVPAVAIGAFLGAITNFIMGRHWSFMAVDGVARYQAIKYAVVSGGSLGLNCIGVYCFTDILGLKYVVSKVIIALLVGVFFNFPLHRNYVFR